MKRKSIIFIICALLANVMQAQETMQKHEKDNSFLLDIAVGISNEHRPAFAFKGIYSHRYNHNFAFGVGSGIHYNSYELVESESYSLDLPLFINIRGNIKSKGMNKVYPYYSLSLGLFFGVVKANDEYVVSVNGSDPYQRSTIAYYDGLFFTPELGININDFFIGVEFLYGTREKEYHTYHLSNTERDVSVYETEPSYIISLKFAQRL